MHALTSQASANDEPADIGLSRDKPDSAIAGISPTHLERLPDKGRTIDDNQGDDDGQASTVSPPSNVIPIQSKAKAKQNPDYSDWVTVEKRRVSEGVYAHYVRVKDDAGQKKVGLIDYISITDFNKRFSRKKKYYDAYKIQLVAIFKAQTLRTSERTISNPRPSL